MKKTIALILAALLALSGVAALAVDRETVKAVQEALNDAGYDCGTPDGVAGNKTAAAIAAYQEDNGLDVTGEIDDELLEDMGLEEEEEDDYDDDDGDSEEDEVNICKPGQYFATFTLYILVSSEKLKEQGIDALEMSDRFDFEPVTDEELLDDGTYTQTFSNESGDVTVTLTGTKEQDGEYGPVRGASMTLAGRAPDALDDMDTWGIRIFIALCDAAGHPDDMSLVMTKSMQDEEGNWLPIEWGPVLYEDETCALLCEQTGEGDEQAMTVTFLSKNAG